MHSCWLASQASCCEEQQLLPVAYSIVFRVDARELMHISAGTDGANRVLAAVVTPHLTCCLLPCCPAPLQAWRGPQPRGPGGHYQGRSVCQQVRKTGSAADHLLPCACKCQHVADARAVPSAAGPADAVRKETRPL